MNIRPWEKLQAVLPLLSAEQKEGLRKSLERDGQQYDILALPDGRIIDGANRFEQLTALGKKPNYRVLDQLDEEQAFALGIALRMDRGQMTLDQRKELIDWLGKHKEERKEVAKALRDEGKTQKEIAEIVGVDRSTVSKWEAEEKEDLGDEKENVSTNVKNHIGAQKIPADSQKVDCRKKTKKEEKAEIVQRVKAGESQRQVAADFGLAQSAVGKIVKSADKPNKEKPHRIEDDFAKIRALVDKLRVNWTSERDKAVARQFLRQTANGI